MSYSLNSLKWGYMGVAIADYIGGYYRGLFRGNTRN